MITFPLTLKEANQFVLKYHRHNSSTTGCKFAIGVLDKNKLVGVAIAGRPVARLLDDGITLEILRVCTDGTRNANSFLYDKVRKIAGLMGYKTVITYTLEKESGASLKALRAKVVSKVQKNTWNRKNRLREEQPVYLEPKLRWNIPVLN
ncbi:MAG: hypothetical protein NTZ97_01180 [Candidatus Moranbacteria bacterium]|nr:hypothetical protein [Candidatus Moranbacteria bacterium]